jgi:hypothetical protein
VNSLVAEYQTLREEIGRLQEQTSDALEYGILITSGFIALSYSSAFAPEMRWLGLISPSVILIPFLFLIINRIRTTWILGRYIEFRLEPELGLLWERFNRKLRGGRKSKFRSKYALSSAGPLIIIQIGCLLLSGASGVLTTTLRSGILDLSFCIWLAVALFIVIIATVEILMLFRFDPTSERIQDIVDALKDLEVDVVFQQAKEDEEE